MLTSLPSTFAPPESKTEYCKSSNGNFLRKNLKNNIVIKNVNKSESTLMHKEGRLSIYFFPALSAIIRLSS